MATSRNASPPPTLTVLSHNRLPKGPLAPTEKEEKAEERMTEKENRKAEKKPRMSIVNARDNRDSC